MIRRSAIGALAAAMTIALSGCTLVTTLAGAGDSGPGETPTITISDTGTPDPTPTGSIGDGVVDDYVEQTDIPVALGTPITIEGREGNPVGTFQVDSITPGFTECTDDEYVPLETGQYVEVIFTVSADAALAAEDDSWDYPRRFELFLADVVAADGGYLPNELGFECKGIGDWIDDVEPGQTLTGPIYLEVDGAGESFLVEWDYGTQNFQVPYGT